MRQLLQDLEHGRLWLEEVPISPPGAHGLLVESRCSLISPGTERMLLEFGRGSLLDKARAQPDRVRQVIHKVRTDGLAATYDAVKAKLGKPIPLGYSNVGIVSMLGSAVERFAVGDRVVSNGPHAESVLVSELLAARIPDEVTDAEASFTVLGAIALQGVRLLQPQLGESFAVVGLGLVGLLSVQLLRACGARVLALDLNPDRVALAAAFGATARCITPDENPVPAAVDFSSSTGVDGVLLTLATNSDEPIHYAAEMCRQRGRIVLTGVTGLALRRDDFYRKEITFQVSCSYGPGRYDSNYEEGGNDYPLPFTRFTAQRNFESILELLRDKRLDVAPLLSREIDFADAPLAYEALGDGKDLGVLLRYRHSPALNATGIPRTVIHRAPHAHAGTEPVIGVIGAGDYARQVLLPNLKRLKARLKWVAAASGLSAATAASKFGAERSTTDCDEVFNDPQVTAVVVATRHNLHAPLVCQALTSGKHVFVEKPLCLTTQELADIETAVTAHPELLLMVGFNRRYAPLVTALKEQIKGRRSPLSIEITVNAGAVPPDSWVHHPTIGGGRIIGEACHFIDLSLFLAGSPIRDASAYFHPIPTGAEPDTMAAILSFEDGSIASVNYFANGSKRYQKEEVKVFSEGRVIVIDNFKTLRTFGVNRMQRTGSWRQDKGHAGCLESFFQGSQHGPNERAIAWGDIRMVTDLVFRLRGHSLAAS